MNPIAFNLFGLEVRWYGIFIATGVLVAILIAYINCLRKNESFDTLMDIFIIAFPMAIIGARLWYVIFSWNYYKNNLGEIINIRQGGLAIHGGVIFALISAYIYTRVKKLNFWRFADIAAPSIIIAQAIGRWGNFFNGEAHGGEVSYDFISRFPSFIQKGMLIDGKYYHPTFLYECLWNILVCIILLFILHNHSKRADGRVIASYMIFYSIGRFYIEGLRTDSLMFYGLRTAQIVSIAGILLGIIIFFTVAKKKKSMFSR